MSRQIPEINYLMSLVEKRFCKSVMTSTDFYSLAQEIESETHERISASTLKRMWGYVNMTPLPRQTTFCESIKNSTAFQSRFFTANFINSCDLAPDSRVEIGWDPNRKVTLKYMGDYLFEVESSLNSKLRQGDRFEAANFIKGSPLYISRILRDGEYTPSYIAGRQGGLNHLKTL